MGMTSSSLSWWLFVLNAGIELTAGAVYYFAPNYFPSFQKVTEPRGKVAARWWSLAVMGLGIATFFARNAHDSEVSKKALCVGIALYHSLISIELAKKPEDRAGLIFHLPMAVGCLWWLKDNFIPYLLS